MKSKTYKFVIQGKCVTEFFKTEMSLREKCFRYLHNLCLSNFETKEHGGSQGSCHTKKLENLISLFLT